MLPIDHCFTPATCTPLQQMMRAGGPYATFEVLETRGLQTVSMCVESLDDARCGASNNHSSQRLHFRGRGRIAAAAKAVWKRCCTAIDVKKCPKRVSDTHLGHTRVQGFQLFFYLTMKSTCFSVSAVISSLDVSPGESFVK